MTKRIAKKSRKTGLNYGTLEARQVLTSFFWPGTDWVPSSYHIPVNESQIVLSDLSESPEISDQPENGQLIFDESSGTLTYQPNDGFAGKDTFSVTGQANDFTMNVWHSAYATPDWSNVISGESVSLNVLANDYAFKELNPGEDARWWGGWNNRFSWLQDSAGFSIVDVTNPAAGSISISEDGQSLIFEAANEAVGQQQVTYTLEDSRGFRTTGTVVFDVTDQAVDPGSYISDAQWQQERTEDWMERYASSLASGNHWVSTPELTLVEGRVFGRAVDANFANFDEARFSTLDGVQEGDIVKSEGNLLYYVTYGDSNSEFTSYLSIVDVSDPANPMLLSTTGFDSSIKDIFLDEGRVAVVLANDYRYFHHGSGQSNSSFELQVLDVTSPVVPTEVYTASIDGSYTDARLIGDQLYLISQYDTNSGNAPWQVLDSDAIAVSPGDYIDAILQQDSGFGLPTVVVEVGSEQKTVTLAVDQIIRRDDGNDTTLVTTFDVHGDSGEPSDMDLIQSDYVSTVYVSAQSLYLFDGSSVMKFAIEADASVEFSADGILQGTLLNQFAADEHDGHLRVAMTDWTDGSSDVRIFEQVGDSLNVVGSLDDIAPGERIFSTTFVEDQVFVVTFRQIDPLFVIDLSDANSPTITGELKIPGVSNYLQLIDDDILLAVGRDADPMTGIQTDLQISLFDVADPTNPLLLDRYTFTGGRSTNSPLTDWISARPDHHALTFDQTNGLLALPVQFGYGIETVHEVSVFEISRENGIQESGSVSFDSQAQRTVISGEQVVYLSDESLKTAVISDPTNVIASLELPPEESQARGLGAADKVCELIDRVFEEETFEEETPENKKTFDVEQDTTDFVNDVRELLSETERLDVDHVSGWMGQFFVLLDVVSPEDYLPTDHPSVVGENLPSLTTIVDAIEANTVMTEVEKEIAMENAESMLEDVRSLIVDEWFSFEEAFSDNLSRILPGGYELLPHHGVEGFQEQMMLIDQLDLIADRHGLFV